MTKSFVRKLCLGAAMAFVANVASAAELTFATGYAFDFYAAEIAKFEKATGNKVTLIHLPAEPSAVLSQYRLWFAAGDKSVDVLAMKDIWLSAFADHLVDLKGVAGDVIGETFPSIIQSLTVDGRLLALPHYSDGPLLFYRKDLLEKYGKAPPKTWDELTATAKEIQDKERAAGNPDMWGFVFQGRGNDTLTCNALEWIKSSGGGNIVEQDGTISINNEKAVAALERAKGWVGTISPPGIVSYGEEESRGVWQSGNAVFMRQWTYAYQLSKADDSAVKGKFDVAPLPADSGEMSAPTLGIAGRVVSKYSEHQQEAIELVKFLASKEVQKDAALKLADMPAIPSLFDDPDVVAAQPFMPMMKGVIDGGAKLPSAVLKTRWNEANTYFYTAVNDTLSGEGTAAENLEELEAKLTDLKGSGW